MKEDDNNRLIEIESKLAYQEDFLQSLNDTVIEQAKLIDFLVKRLEKIQSDVESVVESSQFNSKPDDELPPHY